MINKNEIKYILFSLIFAVVWFVLIIPFLLKNGIESSSIFLQFMIFNLGLFIFFNIFLKAFVQEKRINIVSSIGFTLLFLALDIFFPPLLVNTSGELLSGPLLVGSGSDYVLGSLALSMGLKGFFVYLFTYVIFPIILLFISAKLIPDFTKSI